MPERRNASKSLVVSGLLLTLLVVDGGAASAQRAPGRLNVMSSPLGEVIVDGRPTGARTPAPALEVAPGEHRVTVRFPGSGRTATPRRVRVESGTTAFAYFRDRAPNAALDATCADGDETSCFQLALREVERGDHAAAEPRLEAYLRLFPDGVYATTARSMLVTLAAEREAAGEPERAGPSGALAAFGGIVLAASLGLLGVRSLRRRGPRRGG
jgi:hypothetical protein